MYLSFIPPILMGFLATYFIYSLSLFIARKFIKIPKFKDLYKPTLLSFSFIGIMLFLPQLNKWVVKMSGFVFLIPILTLLFWLKFKKVKLSIKNMVSIFIITGLTMAAIVSLIIILGRIVVAIDS